MGYNYDEYLDLTPRALSNAMRGHNKKVEAQSKENWERMRTQTTTLVNVQLPKNKRIKPKELFKFPWDYTKPTKQLSRAEAKAILRKWQEKT